MNDWRAWITTLKEKPFITLGLILFIAIPITLILVLRSQDLRSSAAAPDKLETEAGVLSSTGVTRQTDSGASGGNYVLFNKTSVTNAPSPTGQPSSGYGADVYRSQGYCPAPLDNTPGAIKVAGGQSVPSGSPGDVILLERGNTFSFSPQSGRSYGAYTGDNGNTNPFVGNIAVYGVSDIRFDSLDANTIGGRPTGEIVFSNGRLGNSGNLVNVITGGPVKILCNDIGSYGLGPASDNCSLWQPGSSGELTGNKVGGCGDGTGYGKHGIYAKARGIKVAWNTFGDIPGGDNINGQSISIRYSGHVVEHNLTTDPGTYSIGYFPYETECTAMGQCPKNIIRYNKFAGEININSESSAPARNYNEFDIIGNTGHITNRHCSNSFICGNPYDPRIKWTIKDNNVTGVDYIYRPWSICPVLDLSGNTPSAIYGC